MTRVLVVDDEPQIVRALQINLKARRYEVQVADSGTSTGVGVGCRVVRPLAASKCGIGRRSCYRRLGIAVPAG